MSASEAGKLTGRKVLMIAIFSFAIILTPNIVLMVKAVTTFSGLVVPNTYVASQEFDRNRSAQEALHWTAIPSISGGQFDLRITDASGSIVRPDSLSVILGRPTSEREDIELALVETPQGYAANAELEPGNWRVDLRAVSEDGTTFTQRRDIWVRTPE